jgi:hypothetical protein
MSMRKLGVVMALGLAATGCGEATASRTEIVHTLNFSGNGKLFQLTGSLVDPTYAAQYTNPLRLDHYRANIYEDGRVLVNCTINGVKTECSDPPFYTEVVRTSAGPRIRLYDLYGVKIADVATRQVDPNDNPCGDGGGDPNDPGSTPPPGGDGGGDPGDPPDGSTPGDNNNGGNHILSLLRSSDEFAATRAALCLPPPPPSDNPGCVPGSPEDPGNNGGYEPSPGCPTDLDQFKQLFCDLVNQNLQKRGIDVVYDCNTLSDKLEFNRTQRPAVDPPDDVGCNRHIAKPAIEEVKERFELTYGDSCGRQARIVFNNWKQNVRLELYKDGVCGLSPLALDLDGNGVKVSSMERGVDFDLLANGEPVRCGWLENGDAWLALDRNHNGRVDGAAELFGNRTNGQDFADGFAALAELDENRDGRVDVNDPAFADLRIWRDAGRDARSASSELSTLASAGIVALELEALKVTGPEQWVGHGNRIPLISRFIRADGRAGELVDVFLRYEARKRTSVADALYQSVVGSL